MYAWFRQPRAREAAIAVAAGATLLCASLANFLIHNDFPLFRGEVALLTLVIIVASAMMVPFYLGQRQWGRSFLEGLLAACYVDLSTESVALMVVAGLGVALFGWWRRTSLIEQMAVLGCVVLLATLLGLGGKPSWISVQRSEAEIASTAAAKKPAIIHLILDEHIGPEGLKAEGAEGQKLSDELRSFYLANGFAVYGGAYSRHFNTINAIPNILNYDRRLGKVASKQGVDVGPTEYLQSLVDQGYRLTVFQSDFADFCSGARTHECVTYDSSSPRPTLVAPLRTHDRAGLIACKFLFLSDGFMWASNRWNAAALASRRRGWSMPWYDAGCMASSTISSLVAMDALAERLKSVRSGEVIFAHLIVPHHPYVVRRDCTYLPWEQWESLTSGSAVEVRRPAYNEQLRCTVRKISTLLKALSQSPAGANSVVIIHGDHGSRIARFNPNESNLGRFGDADMIAGFSTLFAIRAPGVRPGYFTERQPVPALLRDFAASGFRAAPRSKPPRTPTVYIANSDWKPARRSPLPASWVKSE